MIQVQEQVSLLPYNTFGIEATAQYFSSFSNAAELQELLEGKSWKGLPKLILGGGSNMLLTKDVAGLVMKNEIKGLEISGEDKDFVYIKCGAGEVWHQFILHCVQNNWAGLENLSLIPGNVGASPMQNIGAYGVEIKDSFYELTALQLEDLSIHTFDNKSCEFGYRESVFKKALKNRFVILDVTYKLRKQPQFNTSYGAIEQELEAMGVEDLSIQAISQAVINIRSSKLPNPAEIGNAGSFFKNPEIPAKVFASLQIDFPGIVGYPLPGDRVKLAAGWLIEQCGWKGYRNGDAGVHAKQALVLVNYGHAKGQEIFDLSTAILESVQAKFGVALEREVNII